MDASALSLLSIATGLLAVVAVLWFYFHSKSEQAATQPGDDSATLSTRRISQRNQRGGKSTHGNANPLDGAGKAYA